MRRQARHLKSSFACLTILRCLLEQEWKDYNLEWQEKDYGGVQSIRLPSDMIWTPDILMYNRYTELPAQNKQFCTLQFVPVAIHHDAMACPLSRKTYLDLKCSRNILFPQMMPDICINILARKHELIFRPSAAVSQDGLMDLYICPRCCRRGGPPDPGPPPDHSPWPQSPPLEMTWSPDGKGLSRDGLTWSSYGGARPLRWRSVYTCLLSQTF